MKHLFRKLFHYLGSVSFAILLIGTTIPFVFVGTFIESQTGSHETAAGWIYDHPLFLLILASFFLNILLSALRRWPFKKKHIPFLITHLGLLMLLAGVCAKRLYGVQGSMLLKQNESSTEVALENSLAIHIESKEAQATYRIEKNLWGTLSLTSPVAPFIDLAFSLTEFAPSTIPTFQTWNQEGMIHVRGLNPFPLLNWEEGEPLKLGARVQFFPEPAAPFDLHAFSTDAPSSLLQQLFVEKALLILEDPRTKKTLYKKPLFQALQEKKATLSFEAFPINPTAVPTLYIQSIELPLAGPKRLQNRNSSLSIRLEMSPTLAWIQEKEGPLYALAFDPEGGIYQERFSSNTLVSYLAYDGGWFGYSMPWKIPYFPSGSTTRTHALMHIITRSLRTIPLETTNLTPPLQLLYTQCQRERVDFVETLLPFLLAWEQSGSWLYPESISLPHTTERVLSSLPWERLPPKEQQSIQQISTNTHPAAQFSAYCRAYGINLETLLPEPSEQEMEKELATYWRCQKFRNEVEQAIAPLDALPITEQAHYIRTLPPSSNPLQKISNAYLHLFSPEENEAPSPQALSNAYLQLAPLTKENLSQKREELLLESPLKPGKGSRARPNEKGRPECTLKIEGEKKELTLAYDETGEGIAWPIKQGKYKARFGPEVRSLPHNVTLTEAKRIDYPNSQQPYSYECSLLIDKEPVHLTMNHVHETTKGYRFYLAGLSPSETGESPSAHLIINYAPGRYLLTYLGGVLLTMGTLLLFWFRP